MKVKTYLIVFVIFVQFSSCKFGNKNDGNNSNLIPKTVWSEKDVCNYFKINNNDTAFLNQLKFTRVYKSNDSCSGFYEIADALQMKNVKAEMNLLKGISEPSQRVAEVCRYLYLNIPEIFIDSSSSNAFSYTVNNQNIIEIITDAKEGKLAALCNQYAEIAKHLWLFLYGKSEKTTIKFGAMSQNKGYLFNHTVCLFYFKTQGETKAVVADGMYGYIL
jgi:hypothetical protein